MNTQTEDKLANAKAQGQAQFDSIREMVEALNKAQDARNDDADTTGEDAVDEARRAIEEDALSVEVRSAWVPPGILGSGARGLAGQDKAAEYRILLCTGGPACQIVGELSEHGEPETAKLQVQDWFTPWTDFFPASKADHDTDEHYFVEQIMLAYARCFYFGE